jgi:tetratricopeptide (TPR) repeat protein
MAKYTSEDIKLIAKQMRDKKDGKPFNLLTGAGTSKSAGIPLARELIEEINKKYPTECNRKLKGDQFNDYGSCMSCLDGNQRRELIGGYLNNSKINWAHIAIASMMCEGYISRVITFNFDSILARACGLLGLYPATYDFGAAATVDTSYIANQAIIHLHGQGSGKTILNTTAETKKHIKNIKPLMRTTLQDHSLLVIGYSGGSDAVFRLLCEEYTGREKIWWAGHSENQSAEIDKLIRKDSMNANYIGKCDADEFLIALARELKCFPPTLFKNPFEHLLEELEPLTDFPMTENESVDLLDNTRQKLKSASDEENKKKISLDELIMQGNWQAVIDSGDMSDPEQKDKVVWAYFMLANELSEAARNTKDENLFKQAFETYQQAINLRAKYYQAYNNWGVALVGLAKLKRDVSLYVKSYEKFTKAIELNPQLYATYIFFGCALYAHAELTPKENLYLESYSKFEKAVSLCSKNSDLYLIYNTMGLILIARAKLTIDEYLIEQGIVKYKCAIDVDASSIEAYHNWAVALSELAQMKKDENIYLNSFEQFERASSIKSDDFELYENWSSVLLNAYRLFQKKIYIEKAREILAKAEKLEPHRVYNLACYYSQIQDYTSCKAKLETCKQQNTLPPKKHLLEDKDLENVHNQEWFKDFVKDIN